MTCLLSFVVNAAWQLPLLAAACALLVRLTRPAPRIAYMLWLFALSLSLALPLAGSLRPSRHIPSHTASQAPSLTRIQPFPPLLPVEMRDPQHATDSISAGGPAFFSEQPVTAHAACERWIHRLVRVSHGTLRPIALPAWIAWSIAGSWLVCCAWAMARLLFRRRATAILLSASQPLTLPPAILAEYRHCARKMGISAPPLAECDQGGPALAGLLRPSLLLPSDFVQNSAAERMAAFAHELAHLSRRDQWTQLLGECVAVPLRWHPASIWVLGELDRTRELATDRLAAQSLDSPQQYAASLLSLAQSMLRGGGSSPFALGLFPSTPQSTLLEQRLMHLIQPATALPLRRRLPAVFAGCLLAGSAAGWAAVSPLALTAQNAPAPEAQPVPAPSAPASDPQPAAAAPIPALPAEPALPALSAQASAAIPRPEAEPALPALAPNLEPGVAVDTGVSEPDEPVAVAHGRSASVSNAPGTYLHRWTGRDGQPWVAANRDSAPLTAEQERAIEEKTTKLLSSIDTAKIQRQVEQSTAYLRSPEFQKQMAEAGKIDAAKIQQQVEQSTAYLRSPEFQKQMAEAGRINAEKFQQQFTSLNSAAFQQRMADLQKRMADMNSERMQQQFARMNSPEFQKQMQLRMQSTAQMQAQIAALQARVAALEHQLSASRAQHAGSAVQ